MLQRALVERKRFVLPSQLPIAVGKIGQAAGDIRAIGTESPFVDRQDALLQARRFQGAALIGIDIGEVVQANGGNRMIGPEHFFVNRQRSLVEILGLGEARLVFHDGGEVTHRRRDVGVVFAARGTSDGERTTERRLRIVEASGVLVEIAEIVEDLVVVRRRLGARAVGLLDQFQALLQQPLAVIETTFQPVEIAEVIHRGCHLERRRLR